MQIVSFKMHEDCLNLAFLDRAKTRQTCALKIPGERNLPRSGIQKSNYALAACSEPPGFSAFLVLSLRATPETLSSCIYPPGNLPAFKKIVLPCTYSEIMAPQPQLFFWRPRFGDFGLWRCFQNFRIDLTEKLKHWNTFRDFRCFALYFSGTVQMMTFLNMSTFFSTDL